MSEETRQRLLRIGSTIMAIYITGGALCGWVLAAMAIEKALRS